MYVPNFVTQFAIQQQRPSANNMHRTFPFISIVFCLLLSVTHTLALASDSPVLFNAKYEVSKGIMSIGTTVRSVEKTKDGHYKFESVSKPGGVAKLFTSGKVRETSIWQWQEQQFIPIFYHYKNSGNSKREVKLDFDWEGMEVTNTINGDPWKMSVETGTLDKLLYQLKLMHDLQQGQTTFSYHVADGGKLKTYDIKVTGEQVIELEIGTFNTVVVEYKKNDRVTTMWCAKELQYFPVRIEQQKEEDSAVTADLVKLNGINIPDSVKKTKKIK